MSAKRNRFKHNDYECIRCNFKTNHKCNMKRHLYKTNPCPAERNDIVLTTEIKETILMDRIYHMKQEPVTNTSTISQNIINQQLYLTNNIGTIMNVITPNMSDIDRLTMYLQYKDKELISLCDDVEMTYGADANKLRNNTYRYRFEMSTDDILEIMSNISKCKDKDYSDMNIIYNTKEKKINILDDTNEWSESLVEKGVKVIIEKVQDGYLHEYEKYLIKKILCTSGQDEQVLKDRLNDYYRFLSSFDMNPLCSDRNRHMDVEFVTVEMIDRFYPLYKNIYEKIKQSDKNKMKTIMFDVLRRASEKNIKDLYNSFYALFSTNKDFSEYIQSRVIDE